MLQTIVRLEERVGIAVPDMWQGQLLQGVRGWMIGHPNGVGLACPE